MIQGDTLNIEWWTREYLVRALSRNETVKEAAYDLGICERTIYKLRARYNIHRRRDGSWYYKSTYFTRKICGELNSIT